MSRITTLPLIWLLCTAALGVLGGCGGEPEGKVAPKGPSPHLVELAGVEPGRLAYAADRAGSLRALHEVKVVNQEEGRIVELTVREGDRVAAGQVLARYDDRIARAELDKAEASLAQAEADFERSRKLVAEGFLSAEAMSRTTTARGLARAEVRLLRVRLQHMTLTAPRAGVIAARLVEPGDATPQHSHILTLIDPTRLVTDVSVSELVLPRLSVGDSAQVRVDALGPEMHPGRILRIHPALDPATRSGLVEVVLDPLPPGARPGQYCRVVFAVTGEERLIVPLAALQRDETGEFVFTYQDDGTVRRDPVRTGLRLADRVEIVDGLVPGARVVVKGFMELAAGRKVKPVTGKTEGR
jgi:membrane fusion protein (multidrug efflux system)